MASKRTVRRVRQAMDLKGMARSLGATLAEGVGERLGGVLRPGETMPDLELLLELVAREVDRRVRVLTAVEEKHWENRPRGAQLRTRRDELTLQLAEALADLRLLAAGAYGQKLAAALLGIKGRITRDPDTVLARAKELRAKLLEGATLPAPRRPGVVLDPRALAAQLEAPIVELERVLGEVEGVRAAASHQVVDQDLSRGDYDEWSRHAIRCLESLALLGGQPLLADQIRRRFRPRRRRNAEQTPIPAPDPRPRTPVVA